MSRSRHRLLGLAILFLAGCAGSGRQPMLGAGSGWIPDWGRVGQAAGEAARDPVVWGPLLGAALLQIGDADRNLSDRLREDTPLFGSTAGAHQGSNDWRDATEWLWLGSALLAPGPEPADAWLSLKGRLLTQQWAVAKSARGVTSTLKTLTGRVRPGGHDDRSFPSGHATTASVQAHLACYNLEHAGIPTPALSAGVCRAGLGAALLTAWARIEAGMHYPADVLTGWAIGRFMARTGEAWFGSGPVSPRIGLDWSRDAWELSFRWQF